MHSTPQTLRGAAHNVEEIPFGSIEYFYRYQKEMAEETVLDTAFLRRLERLALRVRRPIPGQMKGAQRSTRRGASVEFADYREYVPGDDLRHVDWNLAARLDRLFVKLFVEEEDLLLALLIDASQSMDFGNPTKFQCAIPIAATLGYIALTNYDRVRVHLYAGPQEPPLPAQRGRSGIIPFLRYLGQLRPTGSARFAAFLRRYAADTPHRGLAVVLSDCLTPDWPEGLKALLARGHQVALIHILAPEEIMPQVTGDLRIIDSETGQALEISITPAVLARYRESLNAFRARVERFCHQHGVQYLHLTSDTPVETVILRALQRIGLVT
ncbi:MAG: DUF58 domain-containing protein [Chloroherpetonaceae bacterium]|nr:DUF58 domain-containing protein [Chthonomonadaceae bacterium]MDW8208831.1 DUF58 domain-containing protein [Chloroherpetonaceae bacterium]